MRIILALAALLVGAVNLKEFFAFGRDPSFSIPESAKPDIYRRKLQERGGRWLKLLSGLVITTLGVVLLIRPAWLGL